MTEVIEVAGYNWSPFFVTIGVIFVVVMGIGLWATVDTNDPSMLGGAFFFFLIGFFFSFMMFGFIADDHDAREQEKALKSLNYSNVEDVGYNQYSASDEDGKYVRLVLAYVPDETDKWWVLQVKE